MFKIILSMLVITLFSCGGSDKFKKPTEQIPSPNPDNKSDGINSGNAPKPDGESGNDSQALPPNIDENGNRTDGGNRAYNPCEEGECDNPAQDEMDWEAYCKQYDCKPCVDWDGCPNN